MELMVKVTEGFNEVTERLVCESQAKGGGYQEVTISLSISLRFQNDPFVHWGVNAQHSEHALRQDFKTIICRRRQQASHNQKSCQPAGVC